MRIRSLTIASLRMVVTATVVGLHLHVHVAAGAALQLQMMARTFSSRSTKQTNDNILSPESRHTIALSAAKAQRRAKDRAVVSRQLCDGCVRPLKLCLCPVLPSERLELSTHVLILQHPTEFRKKTFSTVPLLPLVLKNVSIKVGYSFEPKDLLAVKDAIGLHPDQKPLLLYPGQDALDLDNLEGTEGLNVFELLSPMNRHTDEQQQEPFSSTSSSCSDIPASRLLVMIDGTWGEAKRIARKSSSLIACCQQVQFSAPQNSNYNAIRREPEKHCLSTLESCAQALLLLNDDPNNDNKEDGTVAEVAVTYLQTALRSLIQQEQLQRQTPTPRHFTTSTRVNYKSQQRLEMERQLFTTATNTTTPGPTRTVTKLQDGAFIRPLQLSDALLIDSQWEHRSVTSLETVRRRINMHNLDGNSPCCFGVFAATNTNENDKDLSSLRACILQTEDGALGMLHTDPEYRRLGYASALLKEAARALQARDEVCVAYIMDGNTASEELFRQEGWSPADPTTRRRSGARRAKRKWIL